MIDRSFRRVPAALLFLAALSMAACGGGSDPVDRSAVFFARAGELAGKGDVQAAIESYNRGLAIDTTASAAAMEALLEKCRLEGLFGSYDAAFASGDLLESRFAPLLGDSLRMALASDRASLLAELGRFGDAAAVLEAAPSLSAPLRFEMASFFLRAHEDMKAVSIYRAMTGKTYPPSVRMHAWAGLLWCGASGRGAVGESPAILARKTIALSSRVLSGKEPAEEKIRALRAAGGSLALEPKYRRDASFLLFKALALAEATRQPQLLLQKLRMEANAVVVDKAGPFRDAAAWYASRNLEYGEAVALFLLSGAEGAGREERTEGLRRAFSVAWLNAPPWPSEPLLHLEREGLRRCNGLLLEESRIFDLFDVSAQAGMLDMQRSLHRYPDSLRIEPMGRGVLESELRGLLCEIGGLQQRKAVIALRGRGMASLAASDRALNMKRGKLLELLPKLRALNPSIAEAISFRPVDLRGFQAALGDNQAVVMPIQADSVLSAMVIGKRHLQIAGSARWSGSAAEREAVKVPLEAPEVASEAPMVGPAWTSASFALPLGSVLAPYSHVVIVGTPSLPLQLSGGGGKPFFDKRISHVHSLREFVVFRAASGLPAASSSIVFFPVGDPALPFLHKLDYPHDREFLLWKPFGAASLDSLRLSIGEAMTRTVSASAALLELRRSGEGLWMDISAYGID